MLSYVSMSDEYKIREVAGSPVITVPRQLLRLLDLAIGDKVTYRVAGNMTGGAFVVEPAQKRKKPNGKEKRG